MEDNIKRYKFSCGLEASQEELTLEQDYRIMDLIKSVNLSDLGNTTIADLIKTLSENKLIEKFLSIIFSINDEEQIKSFSKLKNSELKEVVTDFFTLNPIALDLLRALRSAADMTTTSQVSSDSDVMQEDTIPVS
ncbi:MAG: hypothetical protein K1X86_12545 [Ignavibacteria bacterium]|nr:hypothetical protein [Ignavibacteria bacterium]